MSQDVGGALFETSDPQGIIAKLYRDIAGRWLNRDQLACISFLQENGSPDVAERILALKRFQVPAEFMLKMGESTSAAAAFKQQLEMQASFRKNDQ